jgi:hypothetical protein
MCMYTVCVHVHAACNMHLYLYFYQSFTCICNYQNTKTNQDYQDTTEGNNYHFFATCCAIKFFHIMATTITVTPPQATGLGAGALGLTVTVTVTVTDNLLRVGVKAIGAHGHGHGPGCFSQSWSQGRTWGSESEPRRDTCTFSESQILGQSKTNHH